MIIAKTVLAGLWSREKSRRQLASCRRIDYTSSMPAKPIVVTPQQTRRFMAKKAAEKDAYLQQRFQRATVDAERIIHMIIDRYAPTSIYQWGSLLEYRRFNELSDIDIAVTGLSQASTVFHLMGDAEDMTDFPLDIVELERIAPLHRESIIRKGKLVYERPSSAP